MELFTAPLEIFTAPIEIFTRYSLHICKNIHEIFTDIFIEIFTEVFTEIFTAPIKIFTTHSRGVHKTNMSVFT